MTNNVYAYTEPGCDTPPYYPAYISVNRLPGEPGVYSVSVRSRHEQGGSVVRMSRAELLELADQLLHELKSDAETPDV